MANELNISASATFDNGAGGSPATLSVANLLRDVAGKNYTQGHVNVGDAEQAIDQVTGSGTFGYILLINRHATGIVHYRAAATQANGVELQPGDIALFRIPSAAAPRLISDTADTEVEYLLIED